MNASAFAVHTERDHLIIEPEELRFFQVYSPFARRWFERLEEPEVRARIDGQQRGLAYLAKRARGAHAPDSKRTPPFRLTWRELFGARPPPVDHLQSFFDENARRVRVPIPPAGSVAALARLRRFAPRLAEYKGARDLPSLDATSRLSIYFKNGSLTPAQAIAALEIGDATFAEGTSRSAFLREIVWREFYYHVLWHRPDVETQAFLPQFRDAALAEPRRLVRGLEGGAHRLSAGRRRHAPAGRDRMDAQPRAHGGGVVPDQGSAHRLALGRALFHGSAARRRSRAQQRRLAVGGVDRVRSAAVLSHLQSDAAEPEVRSGRDVSARVLTRAARRRSEVRFTCRASRSSITPSRRRKALAMYKKAAGKGK